MSYQFIDLFAGIGGFRQGFEKVGFECVYSSEIDAHACEMYFKNFAEMPVGDITQIEVKSIPKFDILLAGFPCQPFSIAGEKKGFNDTRGTLFFDIVRIIERHHPKVVVLENVKHFKNHDKGNTLKVVLKTLSELGYVNSWKLLNAKDFGVPQNRERTIIVSHLQHSYPFDFEKLNKKEPVQLKTILEEDKDNFEYLNEEDYTLIHNPKKQLSGLIFVGYRNKNIRKKGTRENTEHLSRVHKQPNRIYSSEGTHPTLSSQEPTGRYFIYHQGRVRKLTLKECYRLMGFADNFQWVGSDAKLYNRIGNSIVIPMIEEIAHEIEKQLFSKQHETYLKKELGQLSFFDFGIAETSNEKLSAIDY